ncbi:MAG: hypothetical protein Q9M28_00705, partial [Mariprofundaceae bacterium]|nr:hypothetical protein [Mariprofundaceae bacterium]
LFSWLKKHDEIQEKIKLPLLVSSDIIESLFGKFKYAIERSPRADMNRTVLLIPALCGKRSEISFQQSLSLVRHHDLQAWDEENIPYTIRRKRTEFYSQKMGSLNVGE